MESGRELRVSILAALLTKVKLLNGLHLELQLSRWAGSTMGDASSSLWSVAAREGDGIGGVGRKAGDWSKVERVARRPQVQELHGASSIDADSKFGREGWRSLRRWPLCRLLCGLPSISIPLGMNRLYANEVTDVISDVSRVPYFSR
jgi:hypothetical protein